MSIWRLMLLCRHTEKSDIAPLHTSFILPWTAALVSRWLIILSYIIGWLFIPLYRIVMFDFSSVRCSSASDSICQTEMLFSDHVIIVMGTVNQMTIIQKGKKKKIAYVNTVSPEKFKVSHQVNHDDLTDFPFMFTWLTADSQLFNTFIGWTVPLM